MIAKINQINEALAVWLTKTFGTMWICYAFMVYGLLPAFALFHRHQEAFLYWSNWVQLWSLPLILVGTNILGRDAEKGSTHGPYPWKKKDYGTASRQQRQLDRRLKLSNLPFRQSFRRNPRGRRSCGLCPSTLYAAHDQPPVRSGGKYSGARMRLWHVRLSCGLSPK